MKTNKNILLLITAMILLAASACSPKPATEAPAATQDMTIITKLAETAQSLVFGTLTQLATQAVPSETPTPSFTATPFPSATSSRPMISVSKETNCRLGPDVVYDRVGALVPGVMTEVFALDPSRSYYYIENPNSAGNKCWVWGYYATEVNDFSGLPVYQPGPTPTPGNTSTPGTTTPGATATGPTPTFTGDLCSVVSQSPADNTTFTPGQQYIDVIWVIKNDGTTAWGASDVNINFVSGTNMHNAATYPVAATAAGANATIILDLVVPATAGTYTESWAVVKGSTTMCNVGLTIKVAP
ncbi:NBR1-Ig-like domain-containing protein [Chloroflexota bacterium]